jgi:hypothetical protein
MSMAVRAIKLYMLKDLTTMFMTCKAKMPTKASTLAMATMTTMTMMMMTTITTITMTATTKATALATAMMATMLTTMLFHYPSYDSGDPKRGTKTRTDFDVVQGAGVADEDVVIADGLPLPASVFAGC